MQTERDREPPERPAPHAPEPDRPVEVPDRPVPGVEVEPEPDAENMIPVKHEPGTL